MIALVPLICSCGIKCLRQTPTARNKQIGYIKSSKHLPPCPFPTMLLPTVPRSETANMTWNMILLWIYGWWMIQSHSTAFIYAGMGIWSGTVTIKIWFISCSVNWQVVTVSLMSLSPMSLFLMSLPLRRAHTAQKARSKSVLALLWRRWLLHSVYDRVVVLILCVVLIYLSQVLMITSVTRVLDCSGFISILGFVLVLFDSYYYGISRMQPFCNSWSIRNLLVMLLRLNKSVKLAKSIVSLRTRLFRPCTTFHHFLHSKLPSSHLVDNGWEDRFLLP